LLQTHYVIVVLINSGSLRTWVLRPGAWWVPLGQDVPL